MFYNPIQCCILCGITHVNIIADTNDDQNSDDRMMYTGHNSSHLTWVSDSSSVHNTSLSWPAWLLQINMSRVLVPPHLDMCSTWQPLHHLYYQIAHLTLLLVTVLPLGQGTHPVSVLVLRLGLLVYSALIILWSLVTDCSLDTLSWSAALFVINLVHTIIILVSIYVSQCSAIPSDMLPAYHKLFQPLGVSRSQYLKLLSWRKEVRVVSGKETVITEKMSRVDCISLVLSGR